MFTNALSSTYERFGDATRMFRCCDTDFLVSVVGYRAASAADRGERTSHSLAAQLNAFAPTSAVAQLNRDGSVENRHVARLVRRGREYYERTNGVFDIRHGRVEHELKAYLRGNRDSPPEPFEGSGDTVTELTVTGDCVRSDAPVDLNGLAKGYIVDRVAAELDGLGRSGFVNGGGDMSPPLGVVAIESPYGDSSPLKLLETEWNVATSGGYRRRRKGTDHIYDPRGGHVGSRHESVTVVAKRDCLEADALATTLAVLPTDTALDLATDWPDAEAFLVHSGVLHATEGFHDHVFEQ